MYSLNQFLDSQDETNEYVQQVFDLDDLTSPREYENSLIQPESDYQDLQDFDDVCMDQTSEVMPLAGTPIESRESME